MNRKKKEEKELDPKFNRRQEMRFHIPPHFYLLCRLMNVAPIDMLREFMNNVGCESFQRSADDGIRTVAMEYVIRCGYGQDFYSEEEVRLMFKEMDAIGMLWPDKVSGHELFFDTHAKWRDEYLEYWFEKWHSRIRRKP